MEHYTEMHTRHLLGKLKRAREFLNRTPDWDLCVRPEVAAAKEAEYQALKAALATREHVPSKLEGKLGRRKAAAQNRGQGKSRNR